MKITDMNLICLEECFEYLALGDLLSVADACKRMRRAAQSVYNQRHGENRICLQYMTQNDRVICENSRSCSVGDLKSAFQLLRCFGQLIKVLQLTMNSNQSQFLLLFNAINEYCSESLVNIKLNYCFGCFLDLAAFTKPFKNLRVVELYNCCYSNSVEFKRIFPNVRRFRFDGSSNADIELFNDFELLMDHYSHLEDFDLSVYINIGVSAPMMANLTKVLRLNPQLSKLRLSIESREDGRNGRTHFDEETFRSIIEPMQNLDELTLAGIALIPNFIGNKIHLKNVKKFKIVKLNMKYPFRFDQLEHFHFYGAYLRVNFYDFIDQNPTVKTLSIVIHSDDFSNVNVTRLMQAVPMLTEIKCFYFFEGLSADNVLRFVSNFKLLKTFSFSSRIPIKALCCDELQTRLSTEWRCDWRNPSRAHHKLILKRCDEMKK